MISVNVTNSCVMTLDKKTGKTIPLRGKKSKKRKFTTNLLVSCSIDSPLPKIISVERIKDWKAENDKLKVVENTKYVAVGSPTTFKESETHSMTFKPLPKPMKSFKPKSSTEW